MEENKRPSFPARAIVTAGMPYGNKELHFGHIGGVFIPADVFARFLRDRIGKENVIFVSGTDCYGSTIEGSYEAAQKDGFSGTIEDFVMQNHQKQKAVLDMYNISPDLFGASALGRTGEIHRENCTKVFELLKNNGYLSLQKTKQFYDDKLGVFLNGRQVMGRCPIQGCKSEHAYADECSLGHQFNADELIAPKSVLSGETPSITEVDNWYFDLEGFKNDIEKHV
ncbi:MAG: class I tRNA ligase family protein, partial [Oscillospiraceae bacterium]|nr:class I tRNA ligase family protein [Candidatus Equicaccousia limihippi]